jgi:hypothetical protein
MFRCRLCARPSGDLDLRQGSPALIPVQSRQVTLKQSAILLPTRVLLPVVWLAWAASGVAHTLPISFLTLVPDENYLHLELTLNPFELTFFSELDANRDGRLDPGEWNGQGEKIAWRILDAVQVRVDGRLVVPDIAGLTPSYESHHITVRAHYAVDARKAAVSVESKLAGITSGAHLTQLSFGNGDHTQAARLEGQSNQAKFEPTEKPAAVPDTATTPAKLIESVWPHELTVTLLLTCIVSVLLMSMGSVALFRRRLLVVQSKTPFAEPRRVTQSRQMQ